MLLLYSWKLVSHSLLATHLSTDSVGMTNPCIGLLSSRDDGEKSRRNVQGVQLVSHKSKSKSTSKSTSKSSTTSNTSEDWWPSLSFTPRNAKRWRVLTYRKRVGYGLETYKRVRDAALEWKFEAPNQRMGLLPVPAAADLQLQQTQRQQDPPNLPRPFVAKSRYVVLPNIHSTPDQDQHTSTTSHHCIGAGRRFVSYTSKRILPFLPKIFSINPVMLVYDVVDQRGPTTTYSSTAYATMKGHLFRGEERVTVAIRDETQAVEVEILSISRPAPTIKAKLIWPLAGKLQSSFFHEQLAGLAEIATNAVPQLQD